MRSLALLLLTAPASFGAPVVTIEKPTDPAKPVELKADAGRITTINAEAMGAGPVGWLLLPGQSADLIPDGKRASFVAPAAGRYVIAVFAGGEAVAVVVVVGTPGPEPVPVPPRPVDALVDRLRKTLPAAPTPADRTALVVLVELYRQAPAFAREPKHLTAGDVARALQKAGAALALNGLDGLRDTIAEVIGEGFADFDAPLTTETRAKLTDTLTRIHAALVAVNQ